MDSTLSGIIIGVIGSLIAAGIIYLSNLQRKKFLRNQIEDLRIEEEFLERVRKGNIELLRSSFATLFLAIGLISVAIGLFVFSETIKLPNTIKFLINIGCATISMGVGLGVISHSKSIRKLRNLSEEKKKLQSQIESLERKLKNV